MTRGGYFFVLQEQQFFVELRLADVVCAIGKLAVCFFEMIAVSKKEDGKDDDVVQD